MRWRRLLRRLSLWAVGAVGASVVGALFLRWALQKIDLAAVNHAIASASIPHLLAALGLMVAAFLFRGLRWRLLFRGTRVSTWRLIAVENTAVGVNSIAPLPLLDEPTRVGLLTLVGIPPGTVLATMATMRTFELAAQALIGALGLKFLPPLRPLAPYFVAAATVAALGLAALFIGGPLIKRIPVLGRLALARDFSAGVQWMLRAPLTTLLSFASTVGYALVIGLSGWMLGVSLDLQVGLWGLVVLSLAVIFFTDWLPGLPGAIGTFEFVALYLLGLWQVEASTAFGFAILLHALFFLPPLIVAVCYLPYAGFRSVEAVWRLVQQPWPRAGLASVEPEPGGPEQASPAAPGKGAECP